MSSSIDNVDLAFLGQLVQTHQWPMGFANVIVKSKDFVAMRFVIVDNSRSMLNEDGKKVIEDEDEGDYRVRDCSRWEEVTAAVKAIAAIADAAETPTEIRLLNKSQPITVGQRRDGGESLQKAMELLETQPSGQTPICKQVQGVIDTVQSMAVRLRSMNKVALLIIITDGESSDGNVVEMLKPYEDLPLKIIIRMCTNERDVSDYW